MNTATLPKCGFGRFIRPAWAVLLPAAAALCALTPAYPAAQPANQSRVEAPASEVRISTPRFLFAIPPQPLVSALDRFGETANAHIFYNSRLTKNAMSPGATGSMSADDALRALLAGTPLAAVATGPQEFTLVLNPELAVLPSIDPVVAPVVALRTMRVEVPPANEYRLYASTVRYSVLNALQKDPTLNRRSIRVVVDVWLTPVGNIRHLELQVPTGDAKVDLSIVRTVRNVVIGLSPPLGLPQPIHVKVQPSVVSEMASE